MGTVKILVSCCSWNTAALFKWLCALSYYSGWERYCNKNLQEKLDKGDDGKNSWAKSRCNTEAVQWDLGLYSYALISFKSLWFKFL